MIEEFTIYLRPTVSEVRTGDHPMCCGKPMQMMPPMMSIGWKVWCACTKCYKGVVLVHEAIKR